MEAGRVDIRQDAGADRMGGRRVRECRDPEELEQVAFRNLVRMALAACVEGVSGLQFQRSIARLRLADGVVGDKFHTRDFLKDVEYLGSVCVRSALAAQLREFLPALGIPSKFALVADAANMRGVFFFH